MKSYLNAKIMALCIFTFMFILSGEVFAESCPSQGSTQNKYMASGCSYTTQTRTCCQNGQWSNWDEECPVEEWTYTNEVLPTIVSACSGYGTCPSSICHGSVGFNSKYTSHELTPCDRRAKGNGSNWSGSTSQTTGDGSTCSDVNYYGVNGGENEYHKPGDAYCSGWTESLPDCSSTYGYDMAEACKKRGYEGYLCVNYYYNATSTQIFSYPCYQNGIYCYYLSGGSNDRIRLKARGDASVTKCIKK